MSTAYPRRRKPTPSEQARILAALRDGFSAKSAAARFGLPVKMVRALAKEAHQCHSAS